MVEKIKTDVNRLLFGLTLKTNVPINYKKPFSKF